MNIEPFSVPLTSPLETADGPIEARAGYLVRVTIDGTRGVGEATPLPGWTESRSTCRRTLEEACDRVATDGPRAALEELDAVATPAARHGLSLAVADATARSAGVPLYRHLGREETVDSVPVNAVIGDGNVVQTRAAVERARAAGFRTVKVKVGARTGRTDLERLWAVREACPAIELRVDVNGAWDRETAATAVRAGGIQRVRYLEQPLPAANLSGHAELRGHGVGIALDEGLVEHGIAAVSDAGAADAVVLKPMALGGPDRAADTARRAREAGIEPIVSTTIDGAIARAAAVHVAATITSVPACGLATGDRLGRDLLATDPAPIADGRASVPTGPGNVPPPEPCSNA